MVAEQSSDAPARADATLPILIFDGDCGFCTVSARWAERRFRLDHVSPWQDLDLVRYGLTAEECQQAAQWVARDGSSYGGADAVARALGEGGRISRGTGRLLRLGPMRPAAAILYRMVARYRHRLPGATEACSVRP